MNIEHANMKPDEYIKNALNTEPQEYKDSEHELSPRIDHAVMGIVTEAGELMDAVKRVKIYNAELDKVNLAEEAGDLMWYLAILADELGVSFEEIWDKNIRKLKKRFPEKFTEGDAINRDLEKERKELEK